MKHATLLLTNKGQWCGFGVTVYIVYVWCIVQWRLEAGFAGLRPCVHWSRDKMAGSYSTCCATARRKSSSTRHRTHVHYDNDDDNDDDDNDDDDGSSSSLVNGVILERNVYV